MDAALFAQLLSDKKVTNLKKLGYKYPQANIPEFIGLLKNGFYKPIPLKDFHGNSLVYLEGITQVHLSAAKILLTPQNSSQLYGTKAMEDEIISTFTIENIDFSRDSVRKIMAGYAPNDESENRIYGMKKGLNRLASKNVKNVSCSNLDVLVDVAIEENYIKAEDKARLLKFRDNPSDESWMYKQD